MGHTTLHELRWSCQVDADSAVELHLVEVEYETIIDENPDEVVFRIGGKAIPISRNTLVKFDYEGLLWVNREHAVKMGLGQ